MAAPDVIGFAGPSVPQRKNERSAVVFDMHPLALLHAIAVDGNRLAIERIADRERQ